MDSIIREDIAQVKKSVDLEPFLRKSVLISGGSGFLGSWICDALNQIVSRIVCLDNLSTGVFENIEHLKRSEEHTSELQSLTNLVCRLLLEKKKKKKKTNE